MRNTIAIRTLLATLLIGVGIVAVNAVFPTATYAAEVSVQTAQLIPPGTNTCAPVAITGFTPYVYDNELNSFEFSVQDSSYVAIAASVGNMSIPFNQMNRRAEVNGGVRIHADIVSTPLRGTLPITITLLSAKQGQPVCVTAVSTSVGQGPIVSGPVISKPVPTPSKPSKPSTPSTPTNVKKPTTPTTQKPTPPAPPTMPATTSMKGNTGATGTKAGTGSTTSVLKNICSTSNAPRLWGILLLVYAILVAAVVFGQSRMPAMMRSQEAIAAAIVIPFLLLFGLWYFAESCRINAWAPAIATVIALVGLSVAFWDKPKSGSQGVINLPSGKN